MKMDSFHVSTALCITGTAESRKTEHRMEPGLISLLPTQKRTVVPRYPQGNGSRTKSGPQVVEIADMEPVDMEGRLYCY